MHQKKKEELLQKAKAAGPCDESAGMPCSTDASSSPSSSQASSMPSSPSTLTPPSPSRSSPSPPTSSASSMNPPSPPPSSSSFYSIMRESDYVFPTHERTIRQILASPFSSLPPSLLGPTTPAQLTAATTFSYRLPHKMRSPK
jgi:hypothetical protein